MNRGDCNSMSWPSGTVDPNYLDLHEFSENSSHRLSTGSAATNATTRTSKLDPKIPPAQLQLFLNACKLLDIALLLPSDSLPQFQLHKWAFISDYNIHSFDWNNLLISGLTSANNNDLIGQINRHTQIDNSILSAMSSVTGGSSSGDLSEQFSSLNLELNLDNLKSHSETNSLASGFDTSSTGAPHSLPVNLNTSLNISNTKETPMNITTFIPHVVFINSLLNYLTVSNLKHLH